MGPVSLLKFVAEVAPSGRAARSTLDAFLRDGEAMVLADMDKLEAIFQPKKRIWASLSDESATSFIGRSDRTSTTRNLGQNMIDAKTLQNRLAQVEEVVAKLASSPGDKKLQTQLRQMAAKIHLPSYPNQSKNDLFMNLGEPKVDTVEEGWKAPANVTHPKTASLETLQANSALADQILAQVDATSDKIDQLVTAGRKFNASRAKSDLFEVASKVAEVLNSADLAEPWVTTELSSLASEADRLHGLFAPSKV